MYSWRDLLLLVALVISTGAKPTTDAPGLKCDQCVFNTDTGNYVRFGTDGLEIIIPDTEVELCFGQPCESEIANTCLVSSNLPDEAGNPPTYLNYTCGQESDICNANTDPSCSHIVVVPDSIFTDKPEIKSLPHPITPDDYETGTEESGTAELVGFDEATEDSTVGSTTVAMVDWDKNCPECLNPRIGHSQACKDSGYTEVEDLKKITKACQGDKVLCFVFDLETPVPVATDVDIMTNVVYQCAEGSDAMNACNNYEWDCIGGFRKAGVEPTVATTSSAPGSTTNPTTTPPPKMCPICRTNADAPQCGGDSTLMVACSSDQLCFYQEKQGNVIEYVCSSTKPECNLDSGCVSDGVWDPTKDINNEYDVEDNSNDIEENDVEQDTGNNDVGNGTMNNNVDEPEEGKVVGGGASTMGATFCLVAIAYLLS